MDEFCKHCGAAIYENAKFCENCGNTVPASIGAQTAPPEQTSNVCPACGYLQNPGTKFCKGCGRAAETPQTAQHPLIGQPQRAIYETSQQENTQQPQAAYATLQHYEQQQYTPQYVSQQPPQQYEPQPLPHYTQPQQPKYEQQPQQPQPLPQYQQQQYEPFPPQYAASPAVLKKSGGWILPYRIIAAVLIAALGAGAVFGFLRNKDGASGDKGTTTIIEEIGK